VVVMQSGARRAARTRCVRAKKKAILSQFCCVSV